jgi:hypothetical protein
MMEIINQNDTILVDTFKGLFFYNMEANENISSKGEWHNIIDNDPYQYIPIMNKACATLEQMLKSRGYRIREMVNFGYNTSDKYNDGFKTIWNYEVKFK